MSKDDSDYSFCAVCGKKTYGTGKHRCSSASLGAIDAANTRAENDDDLPYTREPFHRTWARRLSEGFQMLGEITDDIDDGED